MSLASFILILSLFKTKLVKFYRINKSSVAGSLFILFPYYIITIYIVVMKLVTYPHV